MKKLLVLAATALAFLACSKQDVTDIQKAKSEKKIFHAVTESVPVSGTKVYSDENLKVLWNADDRIRVFDRFTYGEQYKFLGTDGANSGDFEKISGSSFVTGNEIDHIFAVYPYTSGTSINNKGTIIYLPLSSNQTYKEKSVGIGANYMVAAGDDMSLRFKNVCGYLRFRFYGNNISVSSVKLEGNNGEIIAGKADVTPVIGGTPTTVMNSAATGTSITLNCETPVVLGTSADEATEFIFVIPAITFSNGFKVTVTSNSGSTFTKSSTKSLTIKRSTMESMAAMEVSL